MLIKPTIDFTTDIHVPHVCELTIRTARMTDLSFVADRARKWRKRVGYLPAGAIRSSIARGWVWKAEIDGLDLGHVLLTGGAKCPFILRHNCVEEDAWNRGIGTIFTRVFMAYSHLASPYTVCRVRTRADITAQLMINLRTGGKLSKAFEPNPYSNGHGVTEWQWKLRQRRLQTPPLTGPLTTPLLLQFMQEQTTTSGNATLDIQGPASWES